MPFEVSIYNIPVVKNLNDVTIAIPSDIEFVRYPELDDYIFQCAPPLSEFLIESLPLLKETCS